MADSYSIVNLENELSVINFDDMDTTTEVKLAAEIGQILLQRNKTLEATLEKNQQLLIEQQAEIDKLVKQSQYLQGANDSSLKISEQLEFTLLEMERNNQELLKQRLLDQDQLKELKERKEFLEQRCENLEESYEYIEEKLTKAQSKIDLCEKTTHNLLNASVSSDSVIEVEEVATPVPSSTTSPKCDKLSKRLDHLSLDLCDTKCEIAQYQERMERLESQLSRLVQKNMELEDVIASQKSTVKSRTTTSGCSSDKHKNSASLAEEIQAVKMSQSLESFADGYFITSTPPKINKGSDNNKTTPKRENNDALIDIDVVDSVSVVDRRRNQRNKLRRAAYLKKQLSQLSGVSSPFHSIQIEDTNYSSEQRVKINVCIEIDSEQDQRCVGLLCRQHKLKLFATNIVNAYKATVVRGLCKILGPLINQPRNYFGTLLLWSNKRWIENNIRIM